MRWIRAKQLICLAGGELDLGRKFAVKLPEFRCDARDHACESKSPSATFGNASESRARLAS